MENPIHSKLCAARRLLNDGKYTEASKCCADVVQQLDVLGDELCVVLRDACAALEKADAMLREIPEAHKNAEPVLQLKKDTKKVQRKIGVLNKKLVAVVELKKGVMSVKKRADTLTQLQSLNVPVVFVKK